MDDHIDPNAKRESNRPGRERLPVSLSRRQFVAATGMTALLGVNSTTGVQAQEGGPSPTPPTSPGRISNINEFIEDPTVVGQNQEPPTVPTTVPYPSANAARDARGEFVAYETEWKKSPYFSLLDGEWDFHFSESLDDLPDTSNDIDGWDSITVPASWQTEGYGTYLYHNISLDFDPYDPPLVPDENNTVGIYRREFDVPASWDGRETFLTFEGVKSAYFVWIDGEYVGYKQGSMTNGEFDITEHVTAGESHTVTVQVYRWSDGTYLENQDMFRFAGIFRSVYLYSTPQVHLRDHFIRTRFDENYDDATLTIDAELANYTDSARGNYTVAGHLYDSSGQQVTSLSASTSVDEGGNVLTLETTVTDPEKWSAEHPNLYDVVFTVTPEGGEPTEAVIEQVGFREYEIDNQQFLVNGEPTNIRGVNRHEHSSYHGRTVPIETAKEDFELMKTFNINAFRCSHYPNDPSVYRLANEYGLYVQDEVNAETHENTSLVDEYPAFHPSFMDRFRRMVQREKNHPSVFTWSTGNEAGLGPAHFDMAEYVAGQDFDDDGEAPSAADPTRFLYHQNNGGTAPYAPIVGPRYISPDDLVSVAKGDEDRPVIMGEYNHAMGNSMGLLQSFWEEIQPPERDPDGNLRNLQGGFIWDWVNQSVLRTEILASFTTPDASENDYTGHLNGDPAIVSSDTGHAVDLDGSDDYIQVGDSSTAPELDFTEPGFTIRVRVRGKEFSSATPFVTRGDHQYAIKMKDPENDPEFSGTEPLLEAFVYDRAEAPDYTAWRNVITQVPSGWSDGWNTITFICTDSQLQLYVNGSRVQSTSHEVSNISVEGYDQPVQIGHNSEQTGRYADATIDWIRMYDRPLSESEVSETPSSPRDGAVLWYGLDEFDQSEEQAVEYRFFDDDGDGPFNLNGLIWADREPQPELWQVKHSHQPVAVNAVDLTAGTVDIGNQFDFTNLNDLDIVWELTDEDKVLQEGTLDLDIPPGEWSEVTVPFSQPTLEPGTEYWLTLSFQLAEDTPYADAGHEVAFEQFEVPFDVPEPPVVSLEDMSSLSVSETDSLITVSGNGFEYSFNTDDGTLSTMIYDENELLDSGPLLNTWRAPIMNEVQGWGTAESNEWYDIGLNDLQHDVQTVRAEEVSGSVFRVEVDTFVHGPGQEAGFETTYLYHVLGSGDVMVGVDFSPNPAMQSAISNWLPRVGLQLAVPKSFEHFQWHGRGPIETYPDRKWGAKIGTYDGSVDDQYVRYLPPTANGNKTETRWAALTDGDGIGLVAFGKSDINVSLNQYENLGEVNYDYQLEEADSLMFNVDHAVTGVGGTPQQPLGEYQVKPVPMSFVIGFRPFDTGETDPDALDKRRVPYGLTTLDTFSAFDADMNDGVIEATVTVTNSGGEGTRNIEVPLTVNDREVATETVEVDPGFQTEVTLTHDTAGSDAEFFEVTIADCDPVLLPPINLIGIWKFKAGDDMTWKAPDLDDSGWQSVEIPANWEDHSDYTDDDVYGWYRRTFTVPEVWEGLPIQIPLGQIDDVDETFFNGTKIAQTGSFPEDEGDYDTAWNVQREYTALPEVIDYGDENVIAVRVFDGTGGGGMWSGPYGPIQPLRPTAIAGDPDGDGRFEDVNNDGETSVADVQTLFDDLDSDRVQNYPEAFDFNADDDVTVSDVVALFREIVD